eukprot:365855-Chlamydomonas_euryale.AAC.2
MDRCGEMVGWIATRQHRWHVFAWSGAERHVADGPHVFCGVSHKNMLAVEGMHFADWVGLDVQGNLQLELQGSSLKGGTTTTQTDRQEQTRTDNQTDIKQIDGRMDGWMERWTDGWTDGRMDGRMDGWMDGWTDGWMDG